MKDYGMLLEKTIEKYWGNPKTPIYFADYYGDKFEMRALLFSIVVHEINYKFAEYTEEEIEELKSFEKKGWDNNIKHKDSIKILEVLADHDRVK